MPLVTTFNCKKLETYLGDPDDAKTISIKLGNSLTLAAGTVLGRKASDDKWYAYNDANSDGTQVARAILQYDIATDSSGNAFFGTAAASELGESSLTVPAYITGDFLVSELTGLDAAGLADLFGRLVFGDALNDANAVIHIG